MGQENLYIASIVRLFISLYDICIGEVWLAGGQSNMEFYMKYDADYDKNIGECENSDIRFYDVPKVCYEGPKDDFDYSQMGVRRTCTPDDLDYYSAVGYYFAKKLWKELQMPVGIIGCNF